MIDPNLPVVLRGLKFNDPERNEAATVSITALATKYKILGSGLWRIVFLMDENRVLKFPTSDGGEMCNDGEASISHENYAEGQHLNHDGFICVIQEYVKPLSIVSLKQIYGKIPDWCYGIDCVQVGLNRNGELKAYDFVHP